MDGLKKLKRAKTQIIMKHPFFGYLTLFLKLKENSNIRSIGVNKDFDMVYNKQYIESKSDEEVEGLVLHEVLHLALAHHFRAKGKDKIISNVAQDIISTSEIFSSIVGIAWISKLSPSNSAEIFLAFS